MTDSAACPSALSSSMKDMIIGCGGSNSPERKIEALRRISLSSHSHRFSAFSRRLTSAGAFDVAPGRGAGVDVGLQGQRRAGSSADQPGRPQPGRTRSASCSCRGAPRRSELPQPSRCSLGEPGGVPLIKSFPRWRIWVAASPGSSSAPGHWIRLQTSRQRVEGAKTQATAGGAARQARGSRVLARPSVARRPTRGRLKT
jgi:hypothetical protein